MVSIGANETMNEQQKCKQKKKKTATCTFGQLHFSHRFCFRPCCVCACVVCRAGVGYLLGLFLLFILLSALALSRKRAWLTVGTRRSFDESADALSSVGDGVVRDSNGEVEVRIGAKTTSMAVHDAETRAREENSRLPFTRMDLAFIDLRYVVTVTEQDDAGVKRTYERALLQGINGFAKAGELTALMVSISATQHSTHHRH